MFNMEDSIRAWSDQLRVRGSLKESDILELESHLRDEIEDLMTAGLSEDEAFLISVKRLGNVGAISREYSKVNPDDLWKYLLPEKDRLSDENHGRRTWLLVILFTLLAGTFLKLPEWFGRSLFDPDFMLFYFKNLGPAVLPFAALFFLLRRKTKILPAAGLLLIFAGSAAAVNLFPTIAPFQTELLTGIHLPLFLWLITGIAYLGEEWKSVRGRMNFIRFTGEAVIYGGLILMGILVLGLFTQMIFSAIGINVSWFIRDYLTLYGGCAAVLTAVYLVEAKKSVVENFAPILAKIFSPLFLVSMAAFLAAMIILQKSPFMERDFLIGFDFMLVLVLGLVLYVISARNAYENNRVYDIMNVILIAAALLIDTVALSGILFRLSAFGFTPNKAAALGENVVLLINLIGLLLLYLRYFSKKIDFERIERFQTSYLSVYAIWLGIVAFAFPPLFGFC